MKRVDRERLKVLASTKELENIMISLSNDKSVSEFFKEKEMEVDSVFKEAESC